MPHCVERNLVILCFTVYKTLLSEPKQLETFSFLCAFHTPCIFQERKTIYTLVKVNTSSLWQCNLFPITIYKYSCLNRLKKVCRHDPIVTVLCAAKLVQSTACRQYWPQHHELLGAIVLSGSYVLGIRTVTITAFNIKAQKYFQFHDQSKIITC